MSKGKANRGTSSDNKAEEPTGDKETSDRVQDRETREKAPASSEKSLTSSERATVAEHSNLSALTLYSIIRREGEEELQRPTT